MTKLRITWVFEPHSYESPMLGRDQAFIDEVARRAGVAIPYIQGWLHEVAPRKGFVLLNTTDRPANAFRKVLEDQVDALAARVIPIDSNVGPQFAETLERWSFPACVGVHEHAHWKSGDDSSQRAGLHGLRAIGEMIGARCEEISPRYGRLTCPDRELPQLLAEYLVALHASSAEPPR